jgi:hypothetical protein
MIPTDKAAIGKAGGEARDRALTSEQKKAIAQRAALARWGARATHRGNFKEQFGIDVECYVLDDATKTAVISERGLGVALGMSASGGSRLPAFLSGQAVSPFVSAELREKLGKPVIFQFGNAVPNMPPTKVHGYDVTILIDICKAILAAESEGKLRPSQRNYAAQARVIVGASAKLGIKSLVYALAGYDPTREEVIEAFKYYVREEAREYEKEFPPQLYAEWYRLYQLQKPAKGRPWKAKHLTVEHVYTPLARSNGKILKLTRDARQSSDRQHDKLHQFLSEVGVKALRTHLGQVLGIARISRNQAEYEQHISTLFGAQMDLPL